MCSDCNQYSSSASGKVWEILKPLQRKGKWVWEELTWLPCDNCPLIQPLWAPASHTQISCFLCAYLCATSQPPSARAVAALICFLPSQLCCRKRWMEHLIWHYILFWGIIPCGEGDGDGLHFWFCSVQLIFMPREEFLLKIFLLLLQFYFWFRGDDFIEWKDLLSFCIQAAIFPLGVLATALFLRLRAHLNSEHSSVLEGCRLCQRRTRRGMCRACRGRGFILALPSFSRVYLWFNSGWCVRGRVCFFILESPSAGLTAGLLCVLEC